MNSTTSFSTEVATIFLVDGVLHSEMHNANPTLAEFRVHLSRVRAYFSGMTFPIPNLVKSPGTNGSSSKELRDFMSTDEFAEFAACIALITDSVVMRAAANLFLRVSRPRCPTQLFTDEAKAQEWAKQFCK